MPSSDQIRTYRRSESAVFLKTKEMFGGLSNMASGFPLNVNGVRIPSSEALYQACRFPHLPEVQELIIAQRSPMTAKMKGKPHRSNSRADWERVQVKVMRWCLRVKLAQNWEKFRQLLLSTEDLPIVEASRRDNFWGAKPVDDETLVGMNVLGRLLMELREEVKSSSRESLLRVDPPPLPDFLLYGKPIQAVVASSFRRDTPELQPPAPTRPLAKPPDEPAQATLFEQSPKAAIAENSLNRRREASRHGFNDLKPYPEMKESSVPWLGQIPEHWEIQRGRHLFHIRKRIAGEIGHPVISVTQTGLRVKDVDSGEGQVSSNYAKYQFVLPGEFAMNSMDLLTGGVGLADCAGVTSPDYRVFGIRDRSRCLADYMLYVLRMLYQNRGFYAWGQGSAQLGRWRLPRKRFNDFPFPIPPLDEQAAIVKFLNHADRRIQPAIRAKQKLITLLHEQKQAIVHQAVTRGLDPNVRLKPSGVEWIEGVPEHWEVRPLYAVAKPKSITGLTSRDLLSVYLDRGVIPFSDVAEKRANATSADLSKYQAVDPGDFVLNNQQAWRGSVGVSNYSGIVSPAYLVLSLSAKFDSGFANLLFRDCAMVGQYVTSSKGVGSIQRNLYWPQLKRAKTFVPPSREQAEIVNHIAKETNEINAAIQRASREINLLDEYRTRLIADAVTGKQDIRAAAVQLTDEMVGGDLTTVPDSFDGDSGAARTTDPQVNGEVAL